MARLYKQGEAKQLGLPGRKAMEIVSGERGARGVTLRLVEIPVVKPGDAVRAAHPHRRALAGAASQGRPRWRIG